MSSRVRAAILALGLAHAGCRGHSPDQRLADEVGRGLARDLGVVPTKVTCERARCAAVVGAVELAVTVTGDRDVTWESDEVVLAAPIAAQVRGQLADLGVTAAVDCGPAVQPVPADGRVTCSIEGGGKAWVRLGDGDQLGVDVALTAAEVAAREVTSNDEALERASRALDSDEAEGTDDDDDDDAGVDALPRGPGF